MHPSSFSIFNSDSLIVQTLKIKLGNIPSLQCLTYTSFFVFIFLFFSFLFVGVALGELQKKMVGFGCGQSGKQAKKGLGFNISAATHILALIHFRKDLPQKKLHPNPLSGINQVIKTDNHDRRPNQMPDSFICMITVLNFLFIFQIPRTDCSLNLTFFNCSDPTTIFYFDFSNTRNRRVLKAPKYTPTTLFVLLTP